MNQRAPKPDLPWAANCPNALDLSLYPMKPHRGDYLLFVGRMSPDKGCHRAIDIAVTAGLPLKIAGKRREPAEIAYFEEFVRPHLSSEIEYLGEVTHGEKVELLQDARATLFPIEWAEPFGLVMIESMACGTPVIATRIGAVPEVIEHGRSGIIVDDYREMVGCARGGGQARARGPAALRRGALLAGAHGGRLRTGVCRPHRASSYDRLIAWASKKGERMPKYLVERRFDVSVTSEGMPDVGTKSKRTIQEHFLGSIVWEHSHVLVDDEGRVTTFCVYEAPDQDTVFEHSKLLGLHDVVSVREIAGDVTPDDFPL